MCWHERRGMPAPEEPLMLLALPDVRQRGDFDCGEAAVDTVLRFLGVRRGSAGDLANEVDGAHPATIEAALRRAGLAVQSGTMTVADLQHHTRQGRPVLCPIATHGGHWVAVRGVGRGFVYVACPTDGPIQFRLPAWLDLWRDSTRAGHGFENWGIAVGNTQTDA